MKAVMKQCNGVLVLLMAVGAIIVVADNVLPYRANRYFQSVTVAIDRAGIEHAEWLQVDSIDEVSDLQGKADQWKRLDDGKSIRISAVFYRSPVFGRKIRVVPLTKWLVIRQHHVTGEKCTLFVDLLFLES